MSRFCSWALGVVVASTLVGCSSSFKDIRVETDAGADIDFGAYRTYAWSASAAIINDPEAEWTPPEFDLGAEISFLVNRELRARGIMEVNDAPDVLVIYALGVDMKSLDVVVEPGGEDQFKEIPRGALLVVLADAETREVAWVGAAVADLLSQPSPDVTRSRLDYAVTTMFKQFPR